MCRRDFVRDGTALACAEMLRGGITCFNDMYFFPGSGAGSGALGRHARIARADRDRLPSAYASDPADYLRKGLELRDRQGEDPLVSFCLAPHAPYTVSDADVPPDRDARRRARPAGASARARDRRARSSARSPSTACGRSSGCGASACSGPNLIAVHAVHLQDEEISCWRRHGCSVAHCPSLQPEAGERLRAGRSAAQRRA